MGSVHNTWMQGLGVDIDSLLAAAGNVAPPTFNPSVNDSTLGTAVVDTVLQLGKGFVKGVQDTSGGIVKSPAFQLASGIFNPAGPQIARDLDAVITGDLGKLAPDPLFNFNIDPTNPNEQKQARDTVESTKDLGLALIGRGDPLALAKSAPAMADVLVNGDPYVVGQGAGKTFVIAGVALGGLAEAGVAEAGAAEAGASEAGSAAAEEGASSAFQSPEAQSVQPPQSFGEAPTQLAPQAPGPITSLDPALEAPAQFSPEAQSVQPPQSFGEAPTQLAPQAPGPIASLDPALEAPAPDSPVPDTVRDPQTLRGPGPDLSESPDTVRDPQTLRGPGPDLSESPDTVRDPQTLRGPDPDLSPPSMDP
jgi:hypothetical protein